MFRLPWISSLLFMSIAFCCTRESSALKQIAPRQDAAAAKLRRLGVYYSYNHAKDKAVAFPDKFRVSLLVKDKEILSSNEELVAEVKISDLSDYGIYRVRYFPVTLNRQTKGEYKLAQFDVVNEDPSAPIVRPSSVYRMFVNLHRKSEEYGNNTAWGHIANPYYVATAGDSSLELARQQIVMRTFKEFYYRKNGWRSGERYPMDCYAYYMWATGFCTKGAANGRTRLHNLFGSRFPYHRGSQIGLLKKRGSIHADYVRKPGHSFMLLAYDPKLKHVWTMEGNFNGTVEVVIRSIDSGWTVGHLAAEHIRPEVFQNDVKADVSS